MTVRSFQRATTLETILIQIGIHFQHILHCLFHCRLVSIQNSTKKRMEMFSYQKLNGAALLKCHQIWLIQMVWARNKKSWFAALSSTGSNAISTLCGKYFKVFFCGFHSKCEVHCVLNCEINGKYFWIYFEMVCMWLCVWKGRIKEIIHISQLRFDWEKKNKRIKSIRIPINSSWYSNLKRAPENISSEHFDYRASHFTCIAAIFHLISFRFISFRMFQSEYIIVEKMVGIHFSRTLKRILVLIFLVHTNV